MNNIKKVLSAWMLVACVLPVAAQYPVIPDSVKARGAKQEAEFERKSDAAWEKALPTVLEEAKKGRPYKPWASKPEDLIKSNIPAFPGAEGGGMYTPGGRGGKVITVTNLNDRGPGSFREACETGGARIIVFNVAGIIRLESPIIVRAPYVTIAGQTAPGDGVCIAGESFWVDTHDVVVRHMRFRRGETKVWHRDDSFGGNPVGNIMIDHCSCTWGLDENISFYRHMYDPSEGQYESKDLKLPTVNVTIQNTISAKALDTYNHAFGSTLGGENCAFARNLWASNSGRNPSIGWNGIFNFVNNVVFNWVHRSSDGGDYTAMFNMINNMEFMNDRFVSLDVQWDLSGKLFNRIPLLKHLKWREVIGFKTLYGTLTDKNNPFKKGNQSDLFEFPSRNGQPTSFVMGDTPYMELNVGIHNIFKILRVDYVRRLNYLNAPNAKKNGVRFVLQFDF